MAAKWRTCAYPGCSTYSYTKYCSGICQKKHERELGISLNKDKTKEELRKAFGKIGEK